MHPQRLQLPEPQRLHPPVALNNFDYKGALHCQDHFPSHSAVSTRIQPRSTSLVTTLRTSTPQATKTARHRFTTCCRSRLEVAQSKSEAAFQPPIARANSRKDP